MAIAPQVIVFLAVSEYHLTIVSRREILLLERLELPEEVVTRACRSTLLIEAVREDGLFYFVGRFLSPFGVTEKSSGRGWRVEHSKTARSATEFP